MNRRELLAGGAVALLGMSAFPFRQAFGTDKKQKVLYFTRSAGFEHDPVKRQGDQLSASEKTLMQWGTEAGIEVVCSKDGSLFDGDLDQFDAFVFYTSGDLTGPCQNPQPDSPISVEGKRRLLAAIEAGKGFVGIHAATDSFRSEGIDPYIAMLGGEFLTHGPQQNAKMLVTAPKFPGVESLGNEFTIHDEWYAQHKFARDLHVILLQETAGMQGDCYRRPPFPATWARMHGRGRVFYTSMGHDAIWNHPTFRQVLMGGLGWALGNVQADVTPNIQQVAPKANVMSE